MATRRQRGLSDEQLDDLRARLVAGGRPRVELASDTGGLPAGTRGAVVRVDDPAAVSECVVVRIKGDDLPFAPTELALPGTARKAAAAAARRRPRRSAAARESSPARTSRASSGSRTAQGAATPPPAPGAAPSTAPASAPTSAAPPQESPAGPTRRPPASRRGAGPVSVEVVLRLGDAGWTVEAARGGRRAAKPVPVSAVRVREAVAALGESTVDKVVSETVRTQRAAAEERAARLRAELAAAEAALRDLET